MEAEEREALKVIFAIQSETDPLLACWQNAKLTALFAKAGAEPEGA